MGGFQALGHSIGDRHTEDFSIFGSILLGPPVSGNWHILPLDFKTQGMSSPHIRQGPGAKGELSMPSVFK